MNFKGDNIGSLSPEILHALFNADTETKLYNDPDRYSLELQRRFSEFFQKSVFVYLTSTSTAANSLALSALVKPYEAIFCSDKAYINTSECDAPEFYTGGAKIVVIDSDVNGKINPDSLRAMISHTISLKPHAQKAGCISLSQATECGTIYTPDELRIINMIAKEYNLPIHMDGTRFANSLITLKCKPADLTWKAGIDVMSFSATQNGAMCAEAIIIFNDKYAKNFDYMHKRAGQLVSKPQFFYCQMLAYLKQDLWLKNATQSITMAQKLAQVFRNYNIEIVYPVESNEVFVKLSAECAKLLKEDKCQFYDSTTKVAHGLYRFVTSWSTTLADIIKLDACLKKHIKNRNFLSIDEQIATATTSLKQAIVEDNIEQMLQVLSDFSLLRYKPISFRVLRDNTEKEKLHNLTQLYAVIAQIKSPTMIYAILAAGFSAFDLGAIFKAYNAKKSYIMLVHILPSLSAAEVSQVENWNDPQYSVCSINRIMPRIPIKSQPYYDLQSVFNALIKFDDLNVGITARLGFNNSVFTHDQLELDLDLINRILQKLYPNGTTNARCIASINQDLKDTNSSITDRYEQIRFKYYWIIAYTVAALAVSIFSEQLLIKYLLTLPEDEMFKVSETYYKLLDLTLNMIRAPLLPCIVWILLHLNESYALSPIPIIKFEAPELEYDYNAAQQRLVKDLSNQFSSTFQEQRPASLLFWQQALKSKTQEAIMAATPNTTRRNKTLLQLA